MNHNEELLRDIIRETEIRFDRGHPSTSYYDYAKEVARQYTDKMNVAPKYLVRTEDQTELNGIVASLEARIKKSEERQTYPEDLLGVGLTQNEAKKILPFLKSLTN